MDRLKGRPAPRVTTATPHLARAPSDRGQPPPSLPLAPRRRARRWRRLASALLPRMSHKCGLASCALRERARVGLPLLVRSGNLNGDIAFVFHPTVPYWTTVTVATATSKATLSSILYPPTLSLYEQIVLAADEVYNKYPAPPRLKSKSSIDCSEKARGAQRERAPAPDWGTRHMLSTWASRSPPGSPPRRPPRRGAASAQPWSR